MYLKQILLLGLAVAVIEAARQSNLNSGKGKAARDEAKALVDDLKKGGKGKSKENDKGNSLNLKNKMKDGTGSEVSRMNQEYRGIRVFGGQVVVVDIPEGEIDKADKSGNAKQNEKQKQTKKSKRKKQTILSGMLVEDLSEDIGDVDKSELNGDKAEKSAKEMKKDKKGIDSAETNVEPIIYVKPGNAEGKAKVAFLVDIDLPEEPSRPQIIVDEEGTLLEEWDLVQTIKAGTGPGGNAKVGKHQYDGSSPDYPKLFVTEASGTCSFSGPDAVIVNLNGSTTFKDAPNVGFSYPCYDQASDEINEGYSPLNDINFATHVVIEMYGWWYQRQPYPQTKPLVANAHYGIGVDNAYFNGGTNEILIGDGDKYFYPMSSLDVVAHEIGHGITSQTSDLVYAGESGGLNEAFSDITGVAATMYVFGMSGVNFKLGETVTKDRFGPQLRCLDNPPCDGGRSIDHISNMTETMNPHYSSGLFNKVFYNLATSLPNEAWDAYDIFVVANTMKWTPTTTFLQAAQGMMIATEELIAGAHFGYSYTHLTTDPVKAALANVGINCSKDSGSWECTK